MVMHTYRFLPPLGRLAFSVRNVGESAVALARAVGCIAGCWVWDDFVADADANSYLGDLDRSAGSWSEYYYVGEGSGARSAGSEYCFP